MPDTTIIFASVSYSVAGAAFLLFTGALLIGWRGALQGSLMIVACLATCIWAGATAYAYWSGWSDGLSTRVLVLTELFRDLAWIVALWSMLKPVKPGQAGIWRPRLTLPIAVVCFAGLAGLETLLGLGASTVPPEMSYVVSLALAITGVILTGTLYQNGSEDERWRNKFLCLAVGGIFAFNIFMNADAILLGRVDASMQQARGIVHVLIAPLLAIGIRRNGLWRKDLFLSRDVVLHSTTFMFGGTYLFLMAVVGYYLRGLGGEWGSVAQVTFMFGAVVLLAVILISGTSRAYLKVFLAKHFYKERYDYREEWHRFIQTLSEGLETTSLDERAIRAVADIVESPGGAIWLKDGDRFVLSGTRNLSVEPFEEPQDGPLVSFLARTQWVIVVEEALANPDAYSGLELPTELRRVRRGWVIVPLWHHGLIGFLLLAEPRAPRRLVWEDFDLLKTIGRQLASYMAEQRAERALVEAREFAEFNRRYAFVIHDIKNIVSELSLVASNFRRYSDNPEFLDDMIETVDEAVGKMNRITDKISSRRHLLTGTPKVTLAPLVERVIAAKQGSAANLRVDVDATAIDATVGADEDRLEAVVGHLVQNALEATEFKGEILVKLRREDAHAVIEVIDDGPGMSAEFIRNDLFRPFRSTKGKGFGIGAFQCRAYARELGGRLDVESVPGAGTTIRVILPESANSPTMRTAETAPEAAQ